MIFKNWQSEFCNLVITKKSAHKGADFTKGENGQKNTNVA